MLITKKYIKLFLVSLLALFIINCASDPPPKKQVRSAEPTIDEVNQALSRMAYTGGPNGYDPFTTDVNEQAFLTWGATNLPNLIKYVDKFAAKNYILEVKGHADSAQGRVSNSYLAKARAKKFYERLVKGNVPKDKMKYLGASASEPIPGIESDARRNRRITFKLIPK